MADHHTRFSQTLARGLRVLECFRTGEPDLGVTQIAQRLDLAPAIVARLIATFVEMGYLYQDKATKRYRLGLGAYLLGLQAQPQTHLRQLARPAMERLAVDTGETVSLNVIDPATQSGICIDSIDSPAPIKLTTRIGSIRPLHRGATRKVLLAFASAEQQADHFRSLGLSPKEEAQLMVAISDIRQSGYAYSENDLDEGAYAIAAPIRLEHGGLIGGIGIAGPVYRLTAEDKERLIARVKTAAGEVEKAVWDRDGPF